MRKSEVSELIRKFPFVVDLHSLIRKRYQEIHPYFFISWSNTEINVNQ